MSELTPQQINELGQRLNADREQERARFTPALYMARDSLLWPLEYEQGTGYFRVLWSDGWRGTYQYSAAGISNINYTRKTDK